MTHAILHSGVPVGTIELKRRDDRATGILQRYPGMPDIVLELFDAWSTVEQASDLPKWQAGQDTATSPSAAIAFQRIQDICNEFVLRDEEGNDVPFERVHGMGYDSHMVLFFTFGTAGDPVPARLRPPHRDEPGYNPPAV